MRGTASVMLAVTALMCAAGTAHSDGIAYKGYEASSMTPVVQSEQRAAIVHRDGLQCMVIAVNLDLEAEERALWIFPVPGTPDQVTLDLVDQFPRFRGSNPRRSAAEAIRELMDTVAYAAVYPAFVSVTRHELQTGGLPAVTVHAEVGKWGLQARVVTAESVDALAEYVLAEDTPVPRDELAAFEPYLSDQYVLVLVRIASQAGLLRKFPQYGRQEFLSDSRWPCVLVEFPTDRAFYPLRPTSTYGEAVVPITLYVVGHVKLEVARAVRARFGLRYYEQAAHLYEGPERFRRALPTDRLPYTLVMANAPAAHLSDDLWFKSTWVFGFAYARLLNGVLRSHLKTWAALAVTACLSYLAAGVCGLLLFRKWRAYAAMGLANVFTAVGVLIAMILFAPQRITGLEGLRSVLPRKLGFCILFIIVYPLLPLLLKQLLLLSV